MTRLRIVLVSVLALPLFVVGPSFPEATARKAPAAKPSYTLFESGQVRPLTLSPGGHLLFACNTPDGRLEILRVTGKGLHPLGSVPVGLEPVAVAARSDREVWVVNHLSDSVSIVRLDEDLGDPDTWDPGRGRPPGIVVRTLLVGDEPRDIVFGGPNRDKAFITAAHRGQNAGFDPQLFTPGIGRADVWVFDAEHPGGGLGGVPLTRITLFTDTPRALATSPDGKTVYAAGFLSGNRTTTIHQQIVTANGGNLPPFVDAAGVPQAPTSLIVKFDGSHWVDETGRVWDAQVKFSLPDKDVFVIDATSTPPAPVSGPAGVFQGVGTVLFNMVVNPQSGRVYVSNTDANNSTRFEGPGTIGGHTVRGHLAESRITVLGPGGVLPRHLNKHINYADCCNPAPNDENRKSLAFPVDMAVTGDGKRLYVAAFGSSKVGTFKTSELEADTFTPDESTQIQVSGGGPSGLALDEHHGLLYVLTRFDNAVKIVDTASLQEVGAVALHNPEPPHIVRGRRFLYDASFSSAHGDSACASCHIFGDFDGLAWDLGVPENTTVTNAGLFTIDPVPFGGSRNMQALKGPMTTQSLRGLANHGAMHWRGDRQNNSEPSAQPDQGAFDENTAFEKFNVAFPSLVGRSDQISSEDMIAFRKFTLEITYPPNPVRNLDDSLTPPQQAGQDLFLNKNRKTDSFFECNGCHVLDRSGNAQFGVLKPGFFGTDGRFSFEFETQIFKIPHLRNLYQKVGMFGMAKTSFFLPESPDPSVDNAFTGDQVRGFGFLHDGSTDTLFRFHGSVVFLQRPPGALGAQDPGNPEGIPPTLAGLIERQNLAQFMVAFDSNLRPIVGQQVTLRRDNLAAVLPRIHLMEARAEAGDCELIVKGAGRGYLYQGSGRFQTDRSKDDPVLEAALLALAALPGGELTFTCVPPGSGLRMGLDRDLDGRLDGDE